MNFYYLLFFVVSFVKTWPATQLTSAAAQQQQQQQHSSSSSNRPDKFTLSSSTIAAVAALSSSSSSTHVDRISVGFWGAPPWADSVLDFDVGAWAWVQQG